jgi:hypothetical protein
MKVMFHALLISVLAVEWLETKYSGRYRDLRRMHYVNNLVSYKMWNLWFLARGQIGNAYRILENYHLKTKKEVGDNIKLDLVRMVGKCNQLRIISSSSTEILGSAASVSYVLVNEG